MGAVLAWLLALFLLAVTAALAAAWIQDREWWSDNPCGTCAGRTIVAGILTLAVAGIGTGLILKPRSAEGSDSARRRDAVAPRTLVLLGSLVLIFGLTMALQHRTETRGTSLSLGIPRAQEATLDLTLTLDTFAQRAALTSAPTWSHPSLGDAYVTTGSRFRLGGKNGRGRFACS